MDCWQRREDMAVPRHGIGAAAKEDRIFVPGGSPIQGFGVTGIHDAFVPGTSPVGDFDRDSFLSSTDIDMLVAEIAANGHKGIFDLSGDCVIDDTDLSKWLSDAAKHNGFSKAYLRGDADLDGTVNATDLNALALNWQGNTSTWSGGDFIVDGVVNVEDLNELALNWRESISTAAAVPEPKCLAMLGIAFGCLGFARRRNRLSIF